MTSSYSHATTLRIGDLTTEVTDLHIGRRHGHPTDETLVLLHAALLDRLMWTDFIAELDKVVSRPVRIIAPDARGHGAAADAPIHDIPQLVDDLVAVLDQLGIARPHVCGLSFGGAVAQGYAITRPDALTSLTLVATAIEFPEGLRARAAAAGVGRGVAGQLDETLVRWFPADAIAAETAGVRYARDRILATTVDRWSAIWRSFAGFDATDGARGVRVPLLAVSGAQDVSTPPARLRAIADAYPDARHVDIDPGTHLLALDRPAELARVVADFLR